MKRIDEVWMFTHVDHKNEEGLIAFLTTDGWMPLLACDEQRLEQLRLMAREIAKTRQIKITLKKFYNYEMLEEISP